MALVEGTIGIILYIILIVLIFKLVKSVIKTILLALLLFTAATGIIGFLVFKDAMDIKENLGNSSKAMYLVDGENVLAGFSFTSLSSGNMTFMELEELEELSKDYRDNDYKPLLGDNYKIFMFDIEVFNDSLNEGIEFEMGKSMSLHLDGEEINQSLYSNDPLELFYEGLFNIAIEQQVKAGKIPSEILDNPEMLEKLKEQFIIQAQKDQPMTPGQARAMVFTILFKSKMSDPEDLKDMYSDFREGSIKIYKETALFKLFRFMPKSFFENMMIKMVGNDQNET